MNKDSSRAFCREMRFKYINRRKNISNSIYFRDYFPFDGMYSKGKIHCSCGMCSAKTRNKNYKRRHIHGNYSPNINYKPSDLKKIQSLDFREKEYKCA